MIDSRIEFHCRPPSSLVVYVLDVAALTYKGLRFVQFHLTISFTLCFSSVYRSHKVHLHWLVVAGIALIWLADATPALPQTVT
jgi:hypothetical protein